MNDNIGYFRRGVQSHAKRREVIGFQVDEFVFCVANVDDNAARREGRAKMLDNRFNERILSAR